jgi:hypothetical protein
LILYPTTIGILLPANMIEESETIDLKGNPDHKKVTIAIERGVRGECEDVSLCMPYDGGIIEAVFDGHKSVLIANFCSQNLPSTLDKFPKVSWDDRKLHYAVMELQDMVAEKFPKKNFGTTAVIAFISSTYDIYIACIGDARAMLVDTSTGEIMKLREGGMIKVDDCMEEEFKKYDIKVVEDATSYITRSHCYSGFSTPEYEYYRRVHKVKFVSMAGVYYAELGESALQPLRAIGDTSIKCLIRVPQLYCWRLNGNQMKDAGLILMSDGFENHEVLVPNKMAMFMANPMKYLNDPLNFTEGTFISKYKYINSNDIKSLSTLEAIRYIYNKLIAQIKGDSEWVTTLGATIGKFERAFLKFGTGSIRTDSYKTIELAMYLSIMLGSDDNMTLLFTDLQSLKNDKN